MHMAGDVGHDTAEIDEPRLACDRPAVVHRPKRSQHPNWHAERQPVGGFLCLDAELNVHVGCELIASVNVVEISV